MSAWKNFSMIIVLFCYVTCDNVVDREELDIDDHNMHPYPTNYFKDWVPKFVNDRPVIGILAMEVHGQKILVNFPWTTHEDYFGASFVKLVESAGGRAVPIVEDIEDKELHVLLNKLNGVILPGGDADIADSGYERISKKIIHYSKEQAKKNITFPVMGICRGAQMMMVAEAGKDFLEPTDSLNLSIPLEFTKDAKHSRMFKHMPKGLLRALGELSITFNAHGFGLPTENFYNNSQLQETFRSTSTNYDRKGVQFISTFEGIHAPLYGLQWHPEKVLFVFNPVLAVDHTAHAVISAQYIANFFVGEARKNPNRFRDRYEEEEFLLHSKFTPQYVGNVTETPYEQVYLFDFDNPFQREEEKKKPLQGEAGKVLKIIKDGK